MAQKKITDLQLRSNVSPDLNIPSDDGIQSYRVTATQMKNFVLPDAGLEIEKLADSIMERLVPKGVTFIYPGDTAPTGYLLCDGSLLDRTTYADLFAVVGTKHGTTDGTNFRLPDYRGRFLRGTANGQTTDPDRASRTAMNTGGNTGDNVGSVQGDTMQGHWHQKNAVDYTSQSGSGTGGITAVNPQEGPAITIANGAISDGVNGTPRLSSENRPVNANVNYIIKY